MAMLIEPDGETREVEIPRETSDALDALQMYVGGDIETLPVHWMKDWVKQDGVLVFNEDGKARRLALNPTATMYARTAGIADDDYIVGTALLCDESEVN